jgi:hypothetical protein
VARGGGRRGAYYQALARGAPNADHEFHQRRVERAQRRYLSAVKALAQMRRPQVPAVEVNIGDRQVDVPR